MPSNMADQISGRMTIVLIATGGEGVACQILDLQKPAFHIPFLAGLTGINRERLSIAILVIAEFWNGIDHAYRTERREATNRLGV